METFQLIKSNRLKYTRKGAIMVTMYQNEEGNVLCIHNGTRKHFIKKSDENLKLWAVAVSPKNEIVNYVLDNTDTIYALYILDNLFNGECVAFETEKRHINSQEKINFCDNYYRAVAFVRDIFSIKNRHRLGTMYINPNYFNNIDFDSIYVKNTSVFSAENFVKITEPISTKLTKELTEVLKKEELLYCIKQDEKLHFLIHNYYVNITPNEIYVDNGSFFETTKLDINIENLLL